MSSTDSKTFLLWEIQTSLIELYTKTKQNPSLKNQANENRPIMSITEKQKLMD